MQTATLRKGVAAALAATGALHLILAPEYLAEQVYIGGLFILAGLVSIGLASVAGCADDARALAAGALTALAMGVGFVSLARPGCPAFTRVSGRRRGC